MIRSCSTSLFIYLLFFLVTAGVYLPKKTTIVYFCVDTIVYLSHIAYPLNKSQEAEKSWFSERSGGKKSYSKGSENCNNVSHKYGVKQRLDWRVVVCAMPGNRWRLTSPQTGLTKTTIKTVRCSHLWAINLLPQFTPTWLSCDHHVIIRSITAWLTFCGYPHVSMSS